MRIIRFKYRACLIEFGSPLTVEALVEDRRSRPDLGAVPQTVLDLIEATRLEEADRSNRSFDSVFALFKAAQV